MKSRQEDNQDDEFSTYDFDLGEYSPNHGPFRDVLLFLLLMFIPAILVLFVMLFFNFHYYFIRFLIALSIVLVAGFIWCEFDYSIE